MILRYLSMIDFPAPYANRTQIIKMSEAFAGRADFKLFASSLHDTEENVFRAYGVSRPFVLEIVGPAPSFFWPKSLWHALRIRNSIFQEKDETIFYIRDLLLAFLLIMISKKFRQRFYLEVHSLGRFPKFVYRVVFRKARGIISTNLIKRGHIVEIFGISSNKILVAPNGVDINAFTDMLPQEEARQKTGLPLGKPIAMYIGSEQSWKGTGILAECASILRDCIFVLLGSAGEGRQNLYYVPRVAPTKVRDYIAAADILLAPYPAHSNFSRLWTSPMKVLEYMASGKPMVVSDLPALRELVDENTAFFSLPENARSLSEKITWVLEHPSEADKRARAAHERAKEFSWDERSKKILQFITQ